MIMATERAEKNCARRGLIFLTHMHKHTANRNESSFYISDLLFSRKTDQLESECNMLHMNGD